MTTDDLTKRLREAACHGGGCPGCAILREAADEIERLRKPAGPPAPGPRLTAGNMARLDDGRG
jgi:hypothetical protein